MFTFRLLLTLCLAFLLVSAQEQKRALRQQSGGAGQATLEATGITALGAGAGAATGAAAAAMGVAGAAAAPVAAAGAVIAAPFGIREAIDNNRQRKQTNKAQQMWTEYLLSKTQASNGGTN